MSSEPNPALILGRLADERRLRVLSAMALGARSVAEAAARAGVTEDEAARALAHLDGTGIVREGDAGLEVDHGTFSRAARAASTPRKRAELNDATPEQRAVLRNFVDGEGRITAPGPRRQEKAGPRVRRRPLRAWPGIPRAQVNGLLPVHDDIASMRRYLMDEGLLERDAGVYRRVTAVDA